MWWVDAGDVRRSGVSGCALGVGGRLKSAKQPTFTLVNKNGEIWEMPVNSIADGTRQPRCALPSQLAWVWFLRIAPGCWNFG